jgi:hypothetical protein
MTIRASIRESTRNSIGEIPMVESASISWLVVIVPNCAAKAAPVRPAMTMAVMMQPISRVMATATRFATKIEAPNC